MVPESLSRQLIALILTTAFVACKGTGKTELVAAASAAAEPMTPPPAASAAPAPEEDLTPSVLLARHRILLGKMASNGMYPQVCKGAPWFNQTICRWVAARADGKQVERVDGEIFKAYFVKEHWKHVHGTIVGSSYPIGDYEAAVNGYRNHVVLAMDETKFSTNGRFDLWMQEHPSTVTITVRSGASQEWVMLHEASVAKSLMDLAHSGYGIEATATAKNAMGQIADYTTYAELKDDAPVLEVPAPGWAKDEAVAVAPVKETTSAVAPTTAPVDAANTAPPEVAAKPRVVAVGTSTSGAAEQAKRQARSACLSKCIAGCNDDANCERGCATTKCPTM